MSKAALDFLQSKFGDAVLETHSQCGDDTAVVRPDRWLERSRCLRDPSMAFDMLVDLCAVDYPEREPRASRWSSTSTRSANGTASA